MSNLPGFSAANERQSPALPVAGAGGADADRLARLALLAARREELLTPVHAVIEVATRLVAGSAAQAHPELANDLRRILGSAGELNTLMEQALAGVRAADSDPQAARSRLRHDMLNRLNPVINYSEMWLEEGADLDDGRLVPDLELLRNMGHRCFALIDTIMDARTVDPAHAEGTGGSDVARIAGLLQRMKSLPGSQQRETGRLLIVDDNAINRDILRRLLESHGHHVAEAADGQRALDFLDREPCDLILLDVVMPAMDGFEVLIRLKDSPRLRDIPVIMISALSEVDSVASCIKLGAEDYLSRPYNAVFLQARIGACLEKRRLRQREVEHLAQIESERRRADDLLHVILPREVVAELKTSNSFIPRRYEGVAVLFADIVDFTPYCDRHSPEDVVQHLQALVECWEEAALRYQIQKIKTIGDAFMAACGLLSAVDNPVLNCLEFGREMILSTQASQTGWNLRVGIHYGPVIGGVLGRRQYLFDLFGDTVNTAARMESHGVPGEIVLSGDAWQQVAHLADGRPLAPAPVKGKGIMQRHQFDGFRPLV